MHFSVLAQGGSICSQHCPQEEQPSACKAVTQVVYSTVVVFIYASYPLVRYISHKITHLRVKYHPEGNVSTGKMLQSLQKENQKCQFSTIKKNTNC